MSVQQTIRITSDEGAFRFAADFNFACSDHLLSLTSVLFRMPVALCYNNGNERIFRLTDLEEAESSIDQLLEHEKVTPEIQKKNLPLNCYVSLFDCKTYSFLIKLKLLSDANEIGAVYLFDKKSHRLHKDKKALLSRLSGLFTESIKKNNVNEPSDFDPLSILTTEMTWLNVKT